MIVVGGADVDDVDVGVVDQILGIVDEFGDALFFAPAFEDVGVDVASCNEFGMF